MRLLIDECVDESLHFLFPEHAESLGFDVLITVDQSIPDQQNLTGRSIALLILRAPTNRLRDLALLVPAATSALRSIRRGDLVRVKATPES